jgi:hypothetical protein
MENAPAPQNTKRTVDYDRILKELAKAKEWMTIHWNAMNSNTKKPNLREFCETNTLEYVRMINHTYPLKKLNNDEECQTALDAEIKEMTEKKNKQANPQPKVKVKPTAAKATAEMDCQTEVDTLSTLSDQPGITHTDYQKVIALDYERRKTMVTKQLSMIKRYNDLLVLLKAQPGWADLVKDFDDDQKRLTNRVLPYGVSAGILVKVESHEEMIENVALRVKEYDEKNAPKPPTE